LWFETPEMIEQVICPLFLVGLIRGTKIALIHETGI
jgi:hypothetical protein